jgi:hypothetical protein
MFKPTLSAIRYAEQHGAGGGRIMPALPAQGIGNIRGVFDKQWNILLTVYSSTYDNTKEEVLASAYAMYLYSKAQEQIIRLINKGAQLTAYRFEDGRTDENNVRLQNELITELKRRGYKIHTYDEHGNKIYEQELNIWVEWDGNGNFIDFIDDIYRLIRKGTAYSHWGIAVVNADKNRYNVADNPCFAKTKNSTNRWKSKRPVR